MNSKSFENVVSQVFEKAKNENYNGLIPAEYKKQYEDRFDEYVLRMGRRFFEIASDLQRLQNYHDT